MTYNGYTNSDSYYWDMYWANIESLYSSIREEGRYLLSRYPGMSDQTLGRNILDAVKAAMHNGGWGYNGVPECFRYIPSVVFSDIAKNCNIMKVNETEFGSKVRETLDD